MSLNDGSCKSKNKLHTYFQEKIQGTNKIRSKQKAKSTSIQSSVFHTWSLLPVFWASDNSGNCASHFVLCTTHPLSPMINAALFTLHLLLFLVYNPVLSLHCAGVSTITETAPLPVVPPGLHIWQIPNFHHDHFLLLKSVRHGRLSCYQVLLAWDISFVSTMCSTWKKKIF